MFEYNYEDYLEEISEDPQAYADYIASEGYPYEEDLGEPGEAFYIAPEDEYKHEIVLNRFKEVCDSISTNKRSIYKRLEMDPSTFYRLYSDPEATINRKFLEKFYNFYKISPSDFYVIAKPWV